MTPFVMADGVREDSLLDPKEVAKRVGCTNEQARKAIAKANEGLLYLNDTYQVHVTFEDDHPAFKCRVICLSIKRSDRQPIHDWRDLQRIKNELTDPEYEAIEIYPAESRLVDTANQYWLWVIADREFRVPLGFAHRHVDDEPLGKSVNRPLDEGQTS